MCYEHWMMVPQNIRNQIWDNYTQGQEAGTQPSQDYVDAAKEAITYVEAALANASKRRGIIDAETGESSAIATSQSSVETLPSPAT